jgi:hypothetical protein
LAFQTNPTARLAGHEDNLLVVEVKRRAVDLEADIRKIEDSFFGRRLITGSVRPWQSTRTSSRRLGSLRTTATKEIAPVGHDRAGPLAHAAEHTQRHAGQLSGHCRACSGLIPSPAASWPAPALKDRVSP